VTRRAIASALIAAWLAAWPWAAPARETPPLPGAVPLVAGTSQALFAPWDDVEAAVIAVLRQARNEILVQAFSFTSRRIARALIDAKARGVDVRVTADAGEIERAEGSRIPELAAAGIAVFVETRYQSAHNKVMVIDAQTPANTVITGSYNWTYAAQRRNAENLLILHGQGEVAARYRANWERHRAEARPYAAR
jgi:phosphatidylserine/phosphatidylglycerophosphate/cardiolipin synthase-like enzyme